ncbi:MULTISPECIES: response regulator transcription factor [Chryseobacterium]|uniref:Helix-turn-helix transcriptional regulator n=1 Tax=Chryseobacterium endophyticum TaxID=1854762 RepID=A0AAU6WRN8_9FLAO|nr:helix-turn-helix transcriptional regulator [uncultured Chryseobacterium sp.]
MTGKYITGAKSAHQLTDVWNDYPEILQNKRIQLAQPKIEDFIGGMFAPGEFYYYTIDFYDSTISGVHRNILKIHDLKNTPTHLKEIIDLIHPADLEFVIEAERMSIEKMYEIGWEHQTELKSSYCFRMITGKDNYEMFHHQAIHTHRDNDGRLVQAINIHSNVQHLIHENPYTVLVSGFGSRNDFHQMFYKKKGKPDADFSLTKREIQILTSLSEGFSAKEIADKVNLSYHTVTTHRKNIFSKMNCNKVSEMVKKAIEAGLI